MAKLFIAFLVLTVGCTQGESSRRDCDGDSGNNVVYVGQLLAQAEKGVKSLGYNLGDLSQLAISSTSNGFYIVMRNDRRLVVCSDADGRIKTIGLDEGWRYPLKFRKHADVQSFKVDVAPTLAEIETEKAQAQSHLLQEGKSEANTKGKGESE